MKKQFTPRFSYVDLHLDAVALCAQGANSRADILLTKSMKEGNSEMNFEEIIAGLTPEAQQCVNEHIETVKSTAVADAVSPLNTKIGELTATNKSLSETIAKTKKDDEPSQEELMKSMPESLRLQFESMQKSIKAMEEERVENLAKSRFEVVKALAVEEATLKSVLKTATPEVFDILTKAAAAIEQGLGVAKGAAGEGSVVTSSDDAYEALEKHATDIAKSENVTPAVAFTMACDQHPELYAKYVKGAE